MLMVVFGAGASYDSFPSHTPEVSPTTKIAQSRPPLGDQLFDNRPDFVSATDRFQRCKAIIPQLRHRPHGTSVEQELQSLQTQAENDPERHRQLAAIRFYLHYMMWELELRWNEVTHGITNYNTLLDRLRYWRKAQERICLVTFNYDRMLEAVLPTVGVQIRDLPDYIASESYKVIKLHGSANWAREVNTPFENLDSRNTWSVAYELIDRAAEIDISQNYRMVTDYPIGKLDQSVLLPALAIPVERKSDYECPPDHLDVLRACIPEVTKLLVIGWRATEITFLQLLAENFRRDVRTMVVAGSSDGAREVTSRLNEAGISGKHSMAPGGFTDFVLNREADEFLKS